MERRGRGERTTTARRGRRQNSHDDFLPLLLWLAVVSLFGKVKQSLTVVLRCVRQLSTENGESGNHYEARDEQRLITERQTRPAAENSTRQQKTVGLITEIPRLRRTYDS